MANQAQHRPDRELVVAEQVSDNTSGVAFEGLDPILGKLGVMIGLLKLTDAAKQAYELIPEWFEDPYGNSKKGFSQNPREFGKLMGELLGELGGNAAGIPVSDPAILGSWYPIELKDKTTGKSKPTGLYLVSIDNDEDDSTALGLGVLKRWGAPATGQSVVDVDVWALLPIILIKGNGDFTLTFLDDKRANPITLGVAVEGTPGQPPLVSENGIEFNGVKFSANIFLQSPASFEVSIEVLGLELAGDEKPRNYSLADLEAITPEQLLETVAALFVGALSKQFPDQKDQILYFAPLFGLSEKVPNLDTQIPTLQWYDLFRIVAEGGDPTKPFLDWFNALTATPTLLQSWMACLPGFLGHTVTKTIVKGNGSRAVPFAAPAIITPIGNLNFTAASVVIDEGHRYFYPGLSFTSKDIPLGSSDAVFLMEADLELAKFQLSGIPTVDLDLDFRANFALSGKDGSPLVPVDNPLGFSVGRMTAGLELAVLSGAIVPHLELIDLVLPAQTANLAAGETPTPPNVFAVVNLLSPGQLATVGATALSAELQKLMGLDKPDASTFLKSVAALIGLVAPAGAPDDWPTPPFSLTGIPDAIKDPIYAWANYYISALEQDTPNGGRRPFTYLLESFAAMLQRGNTALKITGDGTPEKPWLIGICLDEETMPAYLTAFEVYDKDTKDLALTFGLELAPELKFDSLTIRPILALDAVCVNFPNGAPATAAWMNRVYARLELPEKMTTPTIGGAAYSVDSAHLSGGWARNGGWQWSMLVETPTVTLTDGTTVQGATLNYSDQEALRDLVTGSAASFGPLFTASTGLALLNTQTRPALLLAATMGLLPDFSKDPVFQQSGLKWKGFSPLNLTDFSDPLKLIRSQLAANFATSAQASEQLALLAWTISGAAKAPTVSGAGTFADPYLPPLMKGFTLPIWFKEQSNTLGLGLGQTKEWNYPATNPDLRVSILTRINALEYSLSNGKVVTNPNTPSLSFTVVIDRPSGLLVDLPKQGGKLQSLTLGVEMSVGDGGFQVHPLVTCTGAVMPGKTTSTDIDLAKYLNKDFTEQARSGFLTLLNAGIQEARTQVQEKALFKSVYRLLGEMGLAIQPAKASPVNDATATDAFGINSAGWTALLADPLGFLEKTLLDLISDETRRKELIDTIGELVGVKFPTLPPAAVDLLSGMGLLGSAEDHYPLIPQVLLEIVTNPVKTIYERFSALFNDEQRRNTLIARLVKDQTPPNPDPNKPPIPEPFGPFTILATANGLITLAIDPAKPFLVGEDQSPFLKLSGSLQVDLANKRLNGELSTYVPAVGFSMANGIGINWQDGKPILTTPTVNLVWGTGNQPSAPPLSVWPFQAKEFLDEIAYLAPVYTLNQVLNAVFEGQLLKKYPVAQSALEVVGVARNEAGVWKMPSLIGLLLHPLDWLLSDDVLGDAGKFSVEKLVEKFSVFPNKTYPVAGLTTPISIGPNSTKTGLSISGLPYSFFVEINGDKSSGAANFEFGCKQIKIADKKAELDNLNFQLSLSRDYQAAFSGSLELATTVGTELFTKVGFNDGFQLALSGGTPSAPTVGLQLLPFQGWGSLVGQSAKLAVEAIDEAVPHILTHLKPKAPKIVGALESFGSNIPVDKLVKQLTDDLTTGLAAGKKEAELVETLEKTSLHWLQTLFTDPNQVDKTTKAVQDIFAEVPQVGKVTVNPSAKGLLEYQPSDKLPLVIQFGLDKNDNLGLWASMTMAVTEFLSLDIARTGIGVDIDTLSKLSFNFGLEAVIVLDGQNGPGLYLEYLPGSSGENGYFDLGIDPVADAIQPDKRSTYAVQLAPVFFGTKSTPPADLEKAVTNWLLDVIKNVLPRYVSVLVLNNDSVKKWLEFNLFSPLPATTVTLTPIELLLATTVVIQRDSGKYLLNTIDNIEQITPLSFLGNFLKELLKSDVEILKFGESGAIWIEQNPNAAGYYGLRLVAPNFKIPALPNLVLQLGAEDDDWIKNSSKPGNNQKTQPGLQFYVPIDFDPVSIDFHSFNVVLGNIGFDVVGKNGQPIVDLTRFKLGAVEPRVLLDLRFKSGGTTEIVFGGNLTLAEMSLNLAPNQLLPSGGENGSKNAVASNLLGSGSEVAGDKKNPPANPTFSVQAAYTEDIWVNLVSTTSEGAEIIIPVQRNFGPLFIDSLGLGWHEEGPKLDLLFTGKVTLAGLEIAMIGLDVGIPVKTPTDFSAYTLGLEGLDVTYKGGSVEINGGLLKIEKDGNLMYNGTAIIKAGTFSLVAMGSYAQIKDPAHGDKKVTSMFIFAALDIPLGGPPAFFVTGLAAGFGYNRNLKLPSIEGVMDFAMVRGVLDGSLTGSNAPNDALNKLASIVSPEVGQYWLAAGLKFSSFELINTAALLFIKFGKDFEIDILGLSYAALPPGLSKEKALVYFELAIKIAIRPSVGIISVEAQLTPNSFVLTRDCKITGGFAFYLWYKNITQTIDGKQVAIPSGQFVITLGGYHPQFRAPVYYPSVPRLGILWKIDVSVGSLTIDGGAYFALCPTAIMAGGYLKVNFVAGPLRAWLDAYANFLIEWKPFFFDIGIGITVGVSFGFTVGGVSISISAELGAKIHLQGPPVNGEVKVTWYVISFTIPIGDQKTETKDANLASWDVFATNFLPPPVQVKKAKPAFHSLASKMAIFANQKASDRQQVVKWNASEGLLNSDDNKDNNPDARWVTKTMFYSFDVNSAVPVSNISVKETDFTHDGVAVGIRPMGFINDLKAPLIVTLADATGPVDLVTSNITLTPILDGSPKALWGKKGVSKTKAPSGEDMILAGTTTGLRLSADRYRYIGNIPAFPIENMKYTFGDLKRLPFALTAKYVASAKLPQWIKNEQGVEFGPFSQIMGSIMADKTITRRNKIYAALAGVQPATTTASEGSAARKLMLKTKAVAAIEASLDVNLAVMEKYADLVLQAFPVLAPIGIYQNNGVPISETQVANSFALTSTTAVIAPPPTPRLLGVLRRYAAGQLAAKDSSPVLEHSVHGKWTEQHSIEATSKRFEAGTLLSGPSSAPASSPPIIYEGGGMLWELNGKETHELKHGRDLELLVACFDDHFVLTALHKTNGKGSLELGQPTRGLFVAAHHGDLHPHIGWRTATKLTKLNSVWAASDGCLVRTQNSQRIRPDRRRERGIISAARLLAGNHVIGHEDKLTPGWIQTVLLTDANEIGVLITGGKKDRPRVNIARNSVPQHTKKLKPTRTIAMGEQTLFVYQTEENCGTTTGGYTGIIVQPAIGSEVVGIFSVPAREETGTASLKKNGIRLHRESLNLRKATPSTTIQILAANQGS